MTLKRLDVTKLENPPSTVEADLVYVHGNTRFEWISTGASIAAASTPYWSGETTGYFASGYPYPYAPIYSLIEKWPFSSDTPSSSVGALSQHAYYIDSYNSSTHGYTLHSNWGDKFPFASDTDGTYLGNPTQNFGGTGGLQSSTDGYTFGGYGPPTNRSATKYPLASDTVGTVTFVGENVGYGGSCGSSTAGYQLGGIDPSLPSATEYVDPIRKFLFATDTTQTDAAELLAGTREGLGASSPTNGYMSGGQAYPSNTLDTIQKFPFSSDSPTSDVAELVQTAYQQTGQAAVSATFAYSAGHSYQDLLSKYPLSSDAPATDVGELVKPTALGAHHHA